jgi:hypothetical protein
MKNNTSEHPLPIQTQVMQTHIMEKNMKKKTRNVLFKV